MNKQIDIAFLYAWFDLWIGFFWDKKKAWFYFLPLPMVGIILKFLPDNYTFKKVKSTWSDGNEIDTYILYFQDSQVGSFKSFKEARKYAWTHNYNARSLRAH